jgi:hypothetical protein
MDIRAHLWYLGIRGAYGPLFKVAIIDLMISRTKGCSSILGRKNVLDPHVGKSWWKKNLSWVLKIMAGAYSVLCAQEPAYAMTDDEYHQMIREKNLAEVQEAYPEAIHTNNGFRVYCPLYAGPLSVIRWENIAPKSAKYVVKRCLCKTPTPPPEEEKSDLFLDRLARLLEGETIPKSEYLEIIRSPDWRLFFAPPQYRDIPYASYSANQSEIIERRRIAFAQSNSKLLSGGEPPPFARDIRYLCDPDYGERRLLR